MTRSRERDGIAHESFQDELDAASLYRVLEDEVVPAFFDRDSDGLPQRWLTRMRRALATLPVRFNRDRMVDEYLRQGYEPASKRGAALRERHDDLVRHEARAGGRIGGGSVTLTPQASSQANAGQFSWSLVLERSGSHRSVFAFACGAAIRWPMNVPTWSNGRTWGTASPSRAGPAGALRYREGRWVA
ncbi:MAG: hypothetical protein B7733_22120 [Myxococcales bacterium FL481]|nr:MAG: hypothetical protein B7733_22120 [Myxococcales bacterium FL481]